MSFKNVRIVSVDTHPLEYLRQEFSRGSKQLPMSSGSLRNFAHCPSRWRAGYEAPDSEAKEFGRLLDCWLLTPDKFDARYAIEPETYESEDGPKKWNNNAKVCRSWATDQMAAGKEIVRKNEVVQCRAAAKRMDEDEVIKAFSDCSDKQVWIAGQWKDEKTGLVIPVKCLIDYVPRKDSEFCKSLGDLKTTRNAQLLPWQRWCFQAGYYVQAAFNLDLYIAATGEDRTDFCFILQENYEPWQTAKRLLSQDFITLGRASYQTMLENYCQCLLNDRWPGYDDTDETSVQGWSIVVPEPFMAEREAFAPKYDFSTAETTENESDDDVPIP